MLEPILDLTISKRFEFAASHRMAVGSWSPGQNAAFFGKEAGSRWGHGHNFTVFFVFRGPVDNKTGMMINVAAIKKKIKALLDARFDHKFLNLDTPPFDQVNPTAENLASRLLEEAAPLFKGETAAPVVCHLAESPWSEATAYAAEERGKVARVERHWWMDFSAARRTYSPFLSDEENYRLFGIAASPSGHGHHYRLRVTLSGPVDKEYGMIFPPQESMEIFQELHSSFDHKNLNADIPEIKGMPITTEMLAHYFYKVLQEKMPVNRIRLSENDGFFVQCGPGGNTLMSVSSHFYAAHRLHSELLSPDENIAVYGICNNPHGHGHLYRAECTISGSLDQRTGALYPLDKMTDSLETALEKWNYKHLDLESDDFKDKPSTGENIVHALWQKLDSQFTPGAGPTLQRLRLWETDNNRFTLRRRAAG
jgi:6-pyruvoyltetrahydropterin/6-carboxytetrahydropterin synthase